MTDAAGLDTGALPRVPAQPVPGDVEASAQRLRAAVLALKAPQAAKRAPAPRSSVYGRAVAAVPEDSHRAATREQLEARFRNAETTALMTGTTLCLVVLPTPGPPPPELLRNLALLSSSGATALILGPSVPRDVPADRSRPLLVPLRADDSLACEWAMVACGPSKRVAFLARQVGDDDRWDWLLTRDSVAVSRAATAVLERVPFLRLRVPPLAG